MSYAHLAILLHAHLPFVHHPEHERFLEEDWLFEGITETYIPLLMSWDHLRDEGVPFRVAMSLTPTLLEMLNNPLLQGRYAGYLQKRIELAERETRHARRAEQERNTAGHYLEQFRKVEAFYNHRCGRNLVPVFKEFQDAGRLEVLGCAATHGLLPLMLTPNAIRAQVAVGLATVERHMGMRPRGFWLPECAFTPGLDEVLAEEGVEYFLVDAHGLLNGYPVPANGVHAPVRCPSGVVAFGRDLESSKQVWSAEDGYPGDGAYREFYRDLGYDADYEDIQPYLHEDGIRRNVGIKYHRVTGRVPLHEKQLYDPGVALQRAKEHGGHFLFCRQHQLAFLHSHIRAAPIVVCPYDAELYGHWWYEGPAFLEQIFRVAQHVRSDFVISTLSEYLDEHLPPQYSTPSSSSWGDKGYFEVWLNGANDWVYRHLHKAEERMVELAAAHAETPPSAEIESALHQAARELLLAQSSDWAFLMTVGTAAPYAEKRTRNHLHRFNRLYQMIRSESISPDYVAELYRQNPIFPDIDFRAYL